MPEAAPAVAPEPVVAPAAPVVAPAPVAEPAAPAAAPDPAAAPAPAAAKPWFYGRIDELSRRNAAQQQQLDRESAARKLAEDTLAELTTKQQQPAPPNGTQQPPGERMYTRAELDRMFAEQAAPFAQRVAAEASFTQECNTVYSKGKEAYPDFDAALASYTPLGGLPANRAFVEAAMETGKPHEVIYSLSKDLEEASRIMSLPPVRQAVALAKYAASLGGGAPGVSRAPAPIAPKVGAGGAKGDQSLDDDKLSTADWMKLREKQLKNRGN